MREPCISAVDGSNLGWALAAPIEVLCGCRQSLPANLGNNFSSKSSQTHYSLVIVHNDMFCNTDITSNKIL
jgi:hypothetical protein